MGRPTVQALDMTGFHQAQGGGAIAKHVEKRFLGAEGTFLENFPRFWNVKGMLGEGLRLLRKIYTFQKMFGTS